MLKSENCAKEERRNMKFLKIKIFKPTEIIKDI